MKYAIYRKANGRVVQYVFSSAPPQGLPASVDCIEFDGYDESTHRVDFAASPAVVVPLTPAAMAAYPTPHDPGAEWDGFLGAWIDTRSLSLAKRQRINQLKAEGVTRIQTRFPAMTDFDTLKMVRELYLSIAPAARSPTTDWQWLVDNYTAGVNAASAVNACTTIPQVDSVTANWPAL